MKVTCVLASYNRPKFVRQALKSVADQTYKNYELLVYDDSTMMDIKQAVSEFSFTEVKTFHTDVDSKRRVSECRVGVNCNAGISISTGDILCFLCDDDYFYPTWFKSAVQFFIDPQNADKRVCFGKLWYSSSREMVFPKDGHGLFSNEPLVNPICKLDHNQLIHRRFEPPVIWPREFGHIGNADACYFNGFMQRGEVFYPIKADCCVKRLHAKSVQATVRELGTPEGELIRE